MSSQSAHWRTEWRSAVFFDESRFCLGVSDERVLVRRRSGERLQPNCLRPRHTGPTPGVMVWVATSYVNRSTLLVIPNTLKPNLNNVDILPWPVRSPDLSPIEHVCNITGRQLQHHPQPALAVPVLTQRVQRIQRVQNSPKMVTNMIVKPPKGVANLALSPRFRQVPIESPL
ncbi:uncharacterized protein TNCV_2187521 [Trichonephila clavipes]|nr:uncharacterized protein TNCV_2187521 [Trichonephila clavipes]